MHSCILCSLNKSSQLALFLFFLSLAVVSCDLLQLEKVEPVPELSYANTGPYITSEENLESVRERIETDSLYQMVLDKHLSNANRRLAEPLYSVTFKDEQYYAPSGDPHDYVSLDTYVWPNPNTADGLPYVRRDGQRNPELANYDREPLSKLAKAVEDLALAWWFTREHIYADKAAEFIRTWFLNDATKMNPHFKYTQFWPGEHNMGSQGIIEAREFIQIIESATLIYDSSAWTGEDHRALKEWFYRFQNWVGSNYNSTAYETTNVGTWLNAQKIIYALFTDQTSNLNNSGYLLPLQQSISNQIEPGGAQPGENRFGSGLFYSWFNLKGYVYQAEMRSGEINQASYLGQSIYRLPGSSSDATIERALQWLYPYASGQRSWTDDGYSQNSEFNKCRFIEIYRPSALALKNVQFEHLVQRFLEDSSCHDITTLLTHPPFSPNQE